jgi:hypothetical protein
VKQAKFRAERCTYTFGGLGEANERPGKYMKELNTDTYRFRDPDEEEEYEDYEEGDEEEGEKQGEEQNELQDEEVVSEEE